jgi:hypothetical protein
MRINLREEKDENTIEKLRRKGFRFDVYCDGHKLDHCWHVDTEEGIAMCYMVDEQGEYVIRDGCIESETYEGEITLKLTTAN